MRCVYLDARDALQTPPQLSNTDYEPLLFHTLTFQVGSAQVAFEALAPLAWGQTKQDLLATAEFEPDGALRSVQLDWMKKGNRMHKTWDNTILGHLKISGRTLVAEVNSALRAEKLRSEIERRLGIMVVHQQTTVRSAREMLDHAKESGTRKASDPQIDPEVAEEFHAQLQAEMESWVDSTIPVLGGMTPRQAIADPDGREIVEGLLLQWERDNEKPSHPGIFRPDVAAVRKLLNI